MGARLLRQAHLFERDREIEAGVRIKRVQPQRFFVAGLCLREAPEVVVDVPEIEMGLEEVGLEADGSLVQRLRLGKLVATIVNVGEIDERRNQGGLELQ